MPTNMPWGWDGPSEDRVQSPDGLQIETVSDSLLPQRDSGGDWLTTAAGAGCWEGLSSWLFLKDSEVLCLGLKGVVHRSPDVISALTVDAIMSQIASALSSVSRSVSGGQTSKVIQRGKIYTKNVARLCFVSRDSQQK